MISIDIMNNEEKKIKDVKEKMVQVLERKKLKDLVKLEEIYVVISENEAIEEKIKVQKVDKKSRLFKNHKKTISIEKVKRNIDANIYRNRFIMR